MGQTDLVLSRAVFVDEGCRSWTELHIRPGGNEPLRVNDPEAFDVSIAPLVPVSRSGGNNGGPGMEPRGHATFPDRAAKKQFESYEVLTSHARSTGYSYTTIPDVVSPGTSGVLRAALATLLDFWSRGKGR